DIFAIDGVEEDPGLSVGSCVEISRNGKLEAGREYPSRKLFGAYSEFAEGNVTAAIDHGRVGEPPCLGDNGFPLTSGFAIDWRCQLLKRRQPLGPITSAHDKGRSSIRGRGKCSEGSGSCCCG